MLTGVTARILGAATDKCSRLDKTVACAQLTSARELQHVFKFDQLHALSLCAGKQRANIEEYMIGQT